MKELSRLTTLLIAFGLAMDAFAVSIAVGLGLKTVTFRHTFRLGFHFGWFQFFMPILGWLAGRQVASIISDYDHWVAFGLLSFVGGKMLWEAWHKTSALAAADPTRGLSLILLSIATSIDALAVGLSMALLGVSIWIPCVIIGLVAAAMTSLGITLGSRLGKNWGTGAHLLGGCVLVLIGLKILWDHLYGGGW